MRNIILLLILTVSMTLVSITSSNAQNGYKSGQYRDQYGYLSSLPTSGLPASGLRTSSYENDFIKVALKNKSYDYYKKVKAAASFIYDNSDKVLSKKTLATIIIMGAPYFYFNPIAAQDLASYGAGLIIRFNGLVAQGIVEGLANNPRAMAKLLSLLTAKEAGNATAKWIVSLVPSAGKFVYDYYKG